jgi:hypothetical protein
VLKAGSSIQDFNEIFERLVVGELRVKLRSSIQTSIFVFGFIQKALDLESIGLRALKRIVFTKVAGCKNELIMAGFSLGYRNK